MVESKVDVATPLSKQKEEQIKQERILQEREDIERM
jgi:hypothetical protein